MAAAELRAEFSRRIDRRIHLPPKPCLRLCQDAGDRCERRIAYDEQVDVTIAAKFPASRGPEDESDHDAVGDRCQRFAQHINGSGGFQEQRPQFRVDRRLAVCPEIDLPPLRRPLDDSAARECVQFTLHRALRRARLPHELT